ncbi:MAG: hypothetical protein Q8Q15_04560 [bacterium]|nr:hypothetical protein [bacterium]
MKYFLLFLALLAIAFLQAVLSLFNFLLVLVLIATFFLPSTWALATAFFAGLIFDLFSGGKVGLSSLGFLFSSFLVIIYNRRFSVQSPFVLVVLTVFFYVVFSLLSAKPIVWFEGLVLVLIMIGLRVILPEAFKGEQERDQRLKL